MKFVSFVKNNGLTSYGAVTEEGIRDIGAVASDQFPDLRSALTDPVSLLSPYLDQAPLIDPDRVKLLPVIPNPDKIFCAGLNYRDHVAEVGRDPTDKPVIFLRVAGSQMAHGDPLIKPVESEQLDYEGELAVIIGRGGRRISAADALNHVAGYACYNDGSVRDWQRHTHQWAPGKNFAGTGAFGPWMVTPDEISDPKNLSLKTFVNGDERQSSNTGLMIFSVEELIAYCSAFVELLPGDVIVSGTPGGVGLKRNPPEYLFEGDVVEVVIENVGTLRNVVAEERA